MEKTDQSRNDLVELDADSGDYDEPWDFTHV